MRRTMVERPQYLAGKPGNIFIGPVRPCLSESEFLSICSTHNANTGARGDLAIIKQSDGEHYIVACGDDVRAYLTNASDDIEAEEEMLAAVISDIAKPDTDVVVMGSHGLARRGRLFNRQIFTATGIERNSSRVRLSPPQKVCPRQKSLSPRAHAAFA